MDLLRTREHIYHELVQEFYWTIQISDDKNLKISMILKKRVYVISLNTLNKAFKIKISGALFGVVNEEKDMKGYDENEF